MKTKPDSCISTFTLVSKVELFKKKLSTLLTTLSVCITILKGSYLQNEAAVIHAWQRYSSAATTYFIQNLAVLLSKEHHTISGNTMYS